MRLQFGMAGRNIVSVQSIKVDELIAFLEQQRLPFVVNRFTRMWSHRFQQNGPRANIRLAPTLQSRMLIALDVDLQPMDISSLGKSEDLVERNCRRGGLLNVRSH